MKEHIRFVSVAVLAMVLCLSGVTFAEWPEKPIEICVSFNTGGGSDILARFIAKAVSDNQLCSVPLTVINKPGGAGQIGLAYVLSKKGNAYTWMTLNPLAGPGQLKPVDFTPIAILATDTFLLVTKKESQFNSVQDVVAAAKASPGAIKVGGTARFADDHFLTFSLGKAAGIELNYINFAGGGEVMSNLLGAHVELAWANPNECLPQVAGGLVKILASTSAERTGKLTHVPTLRELGYDIVWSQMRGVLGPPDMPEQAVKKSAAIFEKVFKTKVWQDDYIKPNELVPYFASGEVFGKMLKRDTDLFIKGLAEMGMQVK